MLLEEHYDVTEHTDGFEAMAGFPLSPPDLVLLDVSLPGMNGLEVLQKIRQHQALQKLPVIALTAHAMSGDRERFLAAGFDDYISKPILDEQLLFAGIRRHLAPA